ncbi:Uncharacterized protein PBTT_04490 [Plasmodiophora brassicae]
MGPEPARLHRKHDSKSDVHPCHDESEPEQSIFLTAIDVDVACEATPHRLPGQLTDQASNKNITAMETKTPDETESNTKRLPRAQESSRKRNKRLQEIMHESFEFPPIVSPEDQRQLDRVNGLLENLAPRTSLTRAGTRAGTLRTIADVDECLARVNTIPSASEQEIRQLIDEIRGQCSIS